MTVAAVTITYNRLDLTKKTVESFYEKTGVDFHLFIDNGSEDGTDDFLRNYNHILLDQNSGIAHAFRKACSHLTEYDFILKLDNDIETVTEDIIAKMLRFYELNGTRYVCSPVDLNIDPAYYPKILHRQYKDGYNVEFTTHTGGAFQLIPQTICRMLCKEFRHLKAGDEMIGAITEHTLTDLVILKDLEMRHIGLNQTSPNYIL